MPKQSAVTQIEFPTFSTVAGKETGHYYRDTFAFDTCQSSDLNATKVYHAIFGYLPKTVVYAMKARVRGDDRQRYYQRLRIRRIPWTHSHCRKLP